jgi:hypothetical protein
MENLRMPPPPPDPIEVVDAAGDTVLTVVPGTIARVVRNVGGAVQQAGAQAVQAVNSPKDTPADAPPDPVSLGTGAVNYVLAIPKGVMGVITGIFNGVSESIADVEGRGRRLTR